MDRQCFLTNDGSHSIRVSPNLTYHSIHGAISESMHVFIRSGFEYAAELWAGELQIFEVGFGTGLNAWLTMLSAGRLQRRVYYEAIEPLPLLVTEASTLNYPEELQAESGREKFELLHSSPWERATGITASFSFCKRQVTVDDYRTPLKFDVIYFDPFDPIAAPALWTFEVFAKLSSLLTDGGILVTYSSKGTVRRNMEAAGFLVEKLPGPAGKREIVRAIRRTRKIIQPTS
ncbi:MAG TPA: tRNA (5-methylaminomethyl-2-thiouridine)(34)-methyltransferase MnmD [Chitinophagaceae bacterium]